ncbi:MAG TPA: hypothetical protein VMB84_07930 [Stellaceae bacterium]|nr:hypothetical protein [Stellaceae bacterium]
MDSARRSRIVNVSLIGLPLAAITAANLIPPATMMRRNNYPDRAACERDYPPPPDRCDQPDGNSSHPHFWHGPYYVADRSAPEARGDPGPGRGVTPASYETSARGGFGAFGRGLRAVA